MNSDLVDIVLRTSALFPDMYQLAAGHQHQVQVSDGLMAVPDGAGRSGGILHKVQLIHFVTMSRVLKIRLVTLADIEDIQRFQPGDFRKRFAHSKTTLYSISLQS